MAGGVNGAKWFWTGLEEYARELGALPEQVATDARGILREEAHAAAVAIVAAYPGGGLDRRGRRRTGRLARGLKVTETAEGAIVRNGTRYATWFEYGNGGQPGGKVFYPIVLPARRRAITRIVGRLESVYGAIVSGELAA